MKITEFRAWLKPFLILSIICGFALTATAQNYYPAEVGNMWVLLSTDGTERRTYALEGPETVNGQELILLKIIKETVGTDTVAFDNSWITVNEDGEQLLHQVAFDRGVFGIAEATYDPPVTHFPAALPLGHTWEIVTETELKLVGAATTTSTLTVVATEDVETPIGVFKDCVKVEINRKAVTALSVLRENEILWLAPDMGPVKFQDTNEIVFDLESYNLVEPVAEDIPPPEETTDEGTEVEAPAEPTVEEPNADGGVDIVPNYYPSEIGNTWVLLSTDGAQQRTYKLEGPENVDGEELIVLNISTQALGTDVVDIDKYFVTISDGALLLHQTITDEGAFGIAEATFEPPVTFFPALLPIGHTWEIVTETELDIAGPVTSTSTIEVVASEDVETPAGTFKDCVKLEIRGRSVSALAVVRTTSYQWLAPDVGPIKYQDDQDIVYELQSYDLVESPTEETPPTEITEPTKLKGDVNDDGVVNIQDLVMVASNLGETGQNPADVNGDGQVNILDLVLVAGALGTSAAAPALHPEALETLTATEVKQWLSAAQQLAPKDAVSLRGILFLQQLLTVLIPKKTALLANYPNPFNPETWIPYHLEKPADVTLHIYAMSGSLVRTLTLGHQPAGRYQNRSQAAYWDGKNQVGEPVASGVYFYTLIAGDFTATRKMLIRK